MLYEHVGRLHDHWGKCSFVFLLKKSWPQSWLGLKSVTWKMKLLRSARRGWSWVCSCHSATVTIHLICPQSQPYLPGRTFRDSDEARLSGLIWQEYNETWSHLNDPTWTVNTQNLYAPALPLWSQALSRWGRQLFWSSGLITSLSFSLSRVFFRPKNVFTNKAQHVGGEKRASGAVQMACQHEWRALGFDLMWEGGCDKCV